jgi:opacity protein-like surface antigen
MKKIIFVITASISALLSFQVFAQAKNFEGFDLNIQTGYTSLNPSTSLSPAQTITIQSDKSNDMPLYFSGGYTLAVNNTYTLGIAIDTDLIKSKKSNTNVYNNGVLQASNGDSAGSQNQYGLSILPGYAVDNTTLAYGRLGYNWAKQYGTNNDGSTFNGDNLKYLNVGIGAKKFIDSNLYVSGEIDYLQLVKINDAGSSGNTPITISTTGNGYALLFGAGYKF